MTSQIIKCDLCEGKGKRVVYVDTKCRAWWNACDDGKIYYIEGPPGNCYVCKGTGKGKPKLEVISCVKCSGKGYEYLSDWPKKENVYERDRLFLYRLAILIR